MFRPVEALTQFATAAHTESLKRPTEEDVLFEFLERNPNVVVIEMHQVEIPRQEKIRIFKDGNQWCAVAPGFINLQESPAGFGDTPHEAFIELKADILIEGMLSAIQAALGTK